MSWIQNSSPPLREHRRLWAAKGSPTSQLGGLSSETMTNCTFIYIKGYPSGAQVMTLLALLELFEQQSPLQARGGKEVIPAALHHLL